MKDELHTPLYKMIVDQIISYVEKKLPVGPVETAVCEFFEKRGGWRDLGGSFVYAEALTARENLVTTWINRLDPEISWDDLEEDVAALACSIALEPEQIRKFLDEIGSNVCESDRKLIRSILW